MKSSVDPPLSELYTVRLVYLLIRAASGNTRVSQLRDKRSKYSVVGCINEHNAFFHSTPLLFTTLSEGATQTEKSSSLTTVREQLSQRLYFLGRFSFFLVFIEIELLFYEFVLESVIRYGLSTWYRNLKDAMYSTNCYEIDRTERLSQYPVSL